MTLIARGRDSDIFRLDQTRVLRRSRDGTSMEGEARVMDYVRNLGFPVPRVEEVLNEGTAMVMEYLEGPTMLATMSSAPAQAGEWCERLAGLLGDLHEVPAPAWLRACPVGTGDRLLHLDLHPLNVIITSTGPQVVDWANAASGDPAVDCALSWLLLACGGERGQGLAEVMSLRQRELCLRGFAAAVEVDMGRALADVTRWKVQDRNINPAEQVAMRRFANRHARQVKSPRAPE